MKIVIEERGKGKTTRLIRESSKLSIPILTTNSQRRMYIRALALQMDILIPKPITVYEIEHGMTRGLNYTNNGVLVDDIDDIVQTYLMLNGLQMIGFSLTKSINKNTR